MTFLSFLGGYLWGVHIWILLYLVLSILLFIAVVLYFNREFIRKKYYEIRFPEKLIKIVVHFKSGYFKEYFRLIPEENEEFMLDSRLYKYSDKSILRDNEFYIRKKNAEIIAVIDGKEYNINDKMKLIKRWRTFPEIHYFFNIPIPIDFNLADKSLEFSSKQLQEFNDNDLLKKLLTLDTERTMLTFLIVLGVLNLLFSIFIIAKMMGWLDK